MNRLLRHWPALPAALILYLGADSFVSQYPSFSGTRAARTASDSAPDSVLVLARRFADADSARASRPAASRENPFRAASERHIPGHGHGKPPPPPPPRHYVLRGTVGTNVATITDAEGRKLIVKVGDLIDSAEVVSIEANKVVLKDRAGKFELTTEK